MTETRTLPGLLLGVALVAMPVTAHAQTPQPHAELDTSALVFATDTFAMVVGGKTVGTQVVSLERVDGGIRFREETSGSFGDQITEVLMSHDGEMRSVHQTGSMSGQEFRIDATYENGRVTGDAVVPRPGGSEEITVAADVPRNVIDDNLLAALLPAYPLVPGESFALPVFSSGRNQLLAFTVRVVPDEPVTIDDQSYEALRLEVGWGESGTIGFIVTAAEPHRLLRIEPPAGPLQVVRARPLSH